MDSQETEVRYRALKPRLECFAESLTEDIRHLLLAYNVQCAFLEWRVKTLESLLAKVQNGDYEDPLHDVKDLVGVRIITDYKDDVTGILEVLRLHYRTEVRRPVAERSEADIYDFSYGLPHVIVQPYDFDESMKRFSDLRAEVQIRSLAEHAWATKSHDLYKATGVPPELERRIARITALTELVDDEFIRIRDEFRAITTRNKLFVEGQLGQISLDEASLQKYFFDSVDLREWERLGTEAGMQPHSFGWIEDARAYYEGYASFVLQMLLMHLKKMGIVTVDEFDSLLQGLKGTASEHLARFVNAAHERGYRPIADPLEIIVNLLRVQPDQGPPQYAVWLGNEISE